MFGARFYHETTRRYVAMFGTLFNDILIRRYDNDGDKEIKKVKIDSSIYCTKGCQPFVEIVSKDA